VSGKVVSLYRHPEFARRAQERAEQELLERVVPIVRLDQRRLRCRRCSLEFECVPRLHASPGPDHLESCPHCEPEIDVDALEAFLNEVLGEP
jgi:hypothetical protein